MKTFKVTQEQIEEAYNASCRDWKEKLKEWFPDAFEEVFKVGDWVIRDEEPTILACVTKYPENVREYSSFYGYGFSISGAWREDNTPLGGGYNDYRKATEEEVKEALFKEAERRYGKNWEAVKLRRHADGNGSLNTLEYRPCFNYECNRLWGLNGLLFQDGEWAEPLEELTCSQKVTWGEDYTFSELPPKVNTSELEQRVASIEKTLKRIEDKL